MSHKNNSIDEIVEIILKSKNVVISGHTSPDGDSIGSTTALYYALKSVECDSTLFIEESSERYDVIPYKNVSVNKEIKEVDTLVLMDCGTKELLPKNIKKLLDKAKNVINIDHHISNDYYGDYNYIVGGFSSTSEIAYDIIKSFTNLNKNMAISLYAGIIYDTGGFKHSCTTPKTHKIVSEIMEFDINANEIYFNILSKMNFKEIEALQLVLSKMKFANNGKINYSYITFEEFKKFNLHKDNLGGIVDFLSSVGGVDVSFFTYSKDGKEYKFSLRSKHTNVNFVAESFGGGGHLNAAGCRIQGNIDEILPKVVDRVIEEMKNVR